MNPYQRNNVETKDERILRHLPAVKKIAYKLISRLPSGIDVDDLIQSGIMGLMEALERYEENRDVSLKTFAEFRIKGAMLDELRNRDWIPRSVRENATKLEKAYRNLRAEGVDHPTEKQLAKELELSTGEFSNFLNKSKAINLLSIDETATEEESEGNTFADSLRDVEAVSQLETLMSKENKERLAEAIDKLEERERTILSLYYREDLNLREIAAVLGLTESRISQLRTKAIAKLRSFFA